MAPTDLTIVDRQNHLLGRQRFSQSEAVAFVENHLSAQSPFVHNEALGQMVAIDEDQRQIQIRFNSLRSGNYFGFLILMDAVLRCGRRPTPRRLSSSI
jgi:hypothetical protein